MKRWRDIRDAKLSPEHAALYPGAVEALPYVRASIASDLRMARMEAGHTPERLAARVGKSANFVRESEAGRADVDERYFFTLWRACRLPARWKPSNV